MLNKTLEVLLKDSGYLGCIPLIEACESDRNIKIIEVDKRVGFTKSALINGKIEKYLEELNIKVQYVDMKGRLRDLDNPFNPSNESVSIKKEKPRCENVVHAPFKRPMSKDKKIKMYNNYKMKMFSVDGETYVNCSDCNNFEKL